MFPLFRTLLESLLWKVLQDSCCMNLNSLLVCLVRWSKEMTFCIELSWMMKCDTFATIQKWQAKACSGKHQFYGTKKAHITSQSEHNAYCVLDHKAIVHLVFQNCYLEVLGRVCEAVYQRGFEFWPDAWILHYCIAYTHNMLTVCDFKAKKKVIMKVHLIIFL
jgi:hypothetical protein